MYFKSSRSLLNSSTLCFNLLLCCHFSFPFFAYVRTKKENTQRCCLHLQIAPAVCPSFSSQATNSVVISVSRRKEREREKTADFRIRSFLLIPHAASIVSYGISGIKQPSPSFPFPTIVRLRIESFSSCRDAAVSLPAARLSFCRISR